MSQPTPAKKKPSFWMTIRTGWRPYRRLFSYAAPYKWRFIVGITFGFLFGAINSLLPLVMAKVAGVVFHGHGTPNAAAIAQHPEMLNAGPKIKMVNNVSKTKAGIILKPRRNIKRAK